MDENKNTEAKVPAEKAPAGKVVKSEYKKPKKEKKKPFNVVDIVLIILLLMFAVVAVFFFAPNTDLGWGTEKTVQIEYTVEISGITKDMAAKIATGDQVFDSENHYSLGVVSNTEIDDYVEYVYNEESGKIEAVPYSDEGDEHSVRKTILVTVTATAHYSARYGYTVNGYRIAVNQDMALCFPGYTGDGQCISATVMETGGNA